eukprot:6748-Prorocentrum_minimum.AAC.1
MTMGTIHMMIKNINLGLTILPPPGSELRSHLYTHGCGYRRTRVWSKGWGLGAHWGLGARPQAGLDPRLKVVRPMAGPPARHGRPGRRHVGLADRCRGALGEGAHLLVPGSSGEASATP